MGNINDIFGSNEYLKAADLNGREFNLVISAAAPKQFDDGNKILLSFNGAEKKLVCNWTNAQTIAAMFGDDFDRWVGQSIVLFPTKVPFGGKMVDAIRVKSPMAQAAPVQNGGHPFAPVEQPVQTSMTADQYREASGAVDLDDEVPFAPDRS